MHTVSAPNRIGAAFARLGAGLTLTVIAAGTAPAAEEIVIGASILLSGPLTGFGTYQKWGYETAVDVANKAGGISIEARARGSGHNASCECQQDQRHPEQRFQARWVHCEKEMQS